jgi:UPF0755 protein
MNKFRVFLAALALATLCLTGLALAGWVTSIPERAELIYGPASPALEGLEGWRLSWSLVSDVDALALSANPGGSATPFEIASGEPAESVINRLGEAGLIRRTDMFRDYLVYSGADTRLVPGDYLLSPAMTPLEIAAVIQNAEAAGVRFFILSGWRMQEVAAALPTSGLSITPESFLKAAESAPGGRLLLHWPSDGDHEGALFPGEYTLPRNLTAGNLLSIFVENFLQHISADIEAAFTAQGLTLFEGIILASIVQREAVNDSEQARIASVFHNRLQAGMRLEADPTVQYALGFSDEWGWWKAPLSFVDLEVVSPYNTYQVIGLPPGPIANPGLPAITATAFPEKTNYYFFRAACDSSGNHVFAVTFEEHVANRCP